MLYDLLVIGAGPAGLAGAIAAAESWEAASRGMSERSPDRSRIAILEKNEEPGRKLLLSGSGQCNVTHAGPIADFLNHYGEHARFVKPALYHWTNAEQVAWLQRLGVVTTVTSGGKVFPRSLSAEEIRNALLREARRLGIDCQCGRSVQRIERDFDGIFHLMTSTDPDTSAADIADTTDIATTDAAFHAEAVVGEYSARCVLLATGGMTYPVTGTTGDGYRFAEQLGHTLVPPRVALAPLVIRDWTTVRGYSNRKIPPEFSAEVSLENVTNKRREAAGSGETDGDLFRGNPPYGNESHGESRGDESRRKSETWRDCAGISLSAVRVSVAKCERFPKGLSRVGDLLWTHRGLSGPVILDMSRYLMAGDTLEVSFVPAALFGNPAALETFLQTEISRHKESVRNLLARMEIPLRLIRVLLAQHQIPGELPTSQMDRKLRKRLVTAILATRFEIAAMGKRTEAMVTCGGVALDEVNRNTMESRRVPRLFFAGEVLDVDGDCGGYNLQFAFSSGKLAGYHCWRHIE
ncbi:MAG: NAD(P)/FAD-dependent oxidoreductase [Thermoguttaceae bacterium]|nr:NAD(P)/FAD-dependent oxidoreductase [Thermoguttaceae bacterium]